MQTMQQVFDRVALHLLQQGKQSLFTANAKDGKCAYRGASGLKCAVGFLISDEAYSSDLESRTVLNFEVEKALHKSGVSTSCSIMGLLGALQSIHDMQQPEHWYVHLQTLAGEFKLTMPALASECQPSVVANAVEDATKEEHAIPELY